MKNHVKAVLATAGLVAAAGVVGASPASADTCGNTRNVSVTGAQSHYTIWCSGGYANIDGWVKDTKADGKCAVVKIQASGETFYSRACGNGQTEWFVGESATPTNTIKVWTYTE
ncbi:hypothetical protein H4N58_01045 [Mumia sp. ZJ1417]|uniref:hypothetical protein n=1 Tax=unclassified Mumia TaxID=2621872 RepID=UPI0014206E21|nr:MULTISPECIES: hypothetical protein [unclassified Mumia]QMW66604.1 hypothetical protein H4N58_01045 [Mumia sp. ZJ1417]